MLKSNKYACSEGGAHLPIAHKLRLPEPTKNPKSEGCVPPLRSGPLAAFRFGFLGWLWQAECALWVSEHPPQRTHIIN